MYLRNGVHYLLLLGLLGGAFSIHAQAAVEISGCQLWLDAGELTGNGTAISPWQDRSGHGFHAVQPDPGRQPLCAEQAINGRSTVRFQGKAFLSVPLQREWSGENWTVFAVASLNADTPANYRGIIGNRFGPGNASWWSLGTKGDGTCYLELAAGVGVNTPWLPATSRACVYTVVKQGEQFSLYRNNKLLGTATWPDVGGMANELRIGMWFADGQEWNGDIAEILLYDRALDDEERNRMETGLAEKWAVPFAGNMVVRESTWAETLTNTRKALRDREHQFGPALWEDGVLGEVWAELTRSFPAEAARFERYTLLAQYSPLEWFRRHQDLTVEKAVIEAAGSGMRTKADDLAAAGATPDDPRWILLMDEAALIQDAFSACERHLDQINFAALRRAVTDLSLSYPDHYADCPAYLKRLENMEAGLPALRERLARCDEAALSDAREILALQREALLANPLLDFDRILLVRRGLASPGLGLVQNWQSNCALPRTGFEDAIATLSLDTPDGALTPVYKPDRPVFVGDVDLHFNADRLLFSSIGTQDRWQIFEVLADGTGLRQVTPGDEPDVDHYDPCYLPDGDIIFASTAFFTAVPCVNGSTRCATLYRMDADGGHIRQLCFDQEHNWCPTVLPNGRILYLRWEYTDTPHSHDRVLFHMNPDGTGQMEYYGSNSYWPNSLFYARPIPGHPGQFAGIVSGHHGVPRMGELVLFDIERGRRESEGAVQRIPGYGKGVDWGGSLNHDSPLIADNLVDASWPKFLHPYPLSDNYFLVSCKPTPESLWGIYLVDVFDNMLLLREEPGYALFEPIPFQKTPVPPVIPDIVDPNRDDALVYLSDVYGGDGLRDIPRGAVKALRLFSYHFLYPDMGGPQAVVGMEGPWDMRIVLGVVPVEEDGSAYFRVPANTPISIQPLDGEGKALQLMRSWFTGMRGETVSCAGCHESQNTAPPAHSGIAIRRRPSEITPWFGPNRGYNYDRELQPVLDKHCAGCHNGEARADGSKIPNLKDRTHITDYTSVFHHGGRDAGHFSVSYAELHRFVRRPGLESDYHLLTPMEFHADATELVQLLRKGHYNVKLDEAAWDRIITWIDFNAPFHGTWTEVAGKERVEYPARRRRELLRRYAAMDTDPEAIPVAPTEAVVPVMPAPLPEAPQPELNCPDWPFTEEEAKKRQEGLGETRRSVELGNGIRLDLVLIPPGAFVMGQADGLPDESPASVIAIDKPFWMGACEVTNAQFARFDPSHDSGVESRFSMQFGVRGFYVNGPEQPAVRVSWDQAMAFCAWLSETTGAHFTLPTEAQWEYACRAGAATPFFYGGPDADWSPYANLADAKLREFVCHTYKKEREPWLDASKYDDWIPKDLRFNDNGFLSDATGQYHPNAWGLYDMHGNVAEWTRSDYKPYPYREDDGRNDGSASERKVVRGGSWRDRPSRARAAFRLDYQPYQPVFNVGFRVILEIP